MLPLLAQAIPAHPTIGETLQYQLVGLAVVMLTLVAIWMALEVSGYFFHRHQLARQARLQAAPEAPAPGLSHREIAALSAAVHATLKGPFHILAVEEQEVTLQPKPQPQQQAWSIEGRRAIFSSHRIR